jgi:4-amino-4-deoxy-L-arabinose transferase-like glycosyltransferase
VRNDYLNGVIFFGAAVVLFLLLLWRSGPRPMHLVSFGRWRLRLIESIRNQPMRTMLIVLSFALAYTTLRLLKSKPGFGNYWDAFFLWLVSFVCYAAALIRAPRVDWRAWVRQHRPEIIAVAVLTVIGAALRFWALGAIPDVVSGDEGIIGTVVMAVLRGQVPNMLITVYNQGALYMYLLAGAVKLFGHNGLGLRFMAAVGGTLSVPLLYLLARRMFNVRVAFIAAALLTVSHFHLHFSRVIVATGIQDALCAIVVFYLFLVGLENRSVSALVLSGIALGLSVYIYMGARLLILLLPALVAALWLVDRPIVHKNLGNLLAFVGAFAIVAAPMTAWALQHPQEFMSRFNQMGVFQSGWLANEISRTGKSPLLIIADLVRQAFLSVNYYPALVHYDSRDPMLDFVSSAMFILGMAYTLYYVTRRQHLLLNGWFWAGLIGGGALAVVPSHNAYRILIIFPAVCLYVALGVDRVIALGSRGVSANRAQWAPVLMFVALVATLNLKSYFVDFAPNCRYGDWATRFASHMGYQLGALGPTYQPYLLGGPNLVYGIHKSVDFLSGGIPIIDIKDPLTGSPTFIDPNSRAVFFFMPAREGELAVVQSYMPGGRVGRLYDCHNLIMVTYVTPGS